MACHGRMDDLVSDLYGRVASVVVAILALIPATRLIIIAELRAIRSRAFYMGFGVVVSLPSQLVFFYEMGFFRHPSALLLFGLLFSGVASLAGYTYWKFAGRRARG